MRDDRAMALWSTGPPGDPTSVGHLQLEDYHGRPTGPLCGLSSNGLYYRVQLSWEAVPGAQRCPECDERAGSPMPPASP